MSLIGSEPPRRIIAIAFLSLAAGCLVREVQKGPIFEARARWVLLPIRNQTETPRAGERTEAILDTLLRAKGITNLAVDRPSNDGALVPELDDRQRVERAIAWAKSQGFKYGVTGTIEEWRYRNGLEGEPAVGLSLQVIDLGSQRVLWSASGAKSGWGRDTLAGTTQELLKILLGDLDLR